MKRNIALLLTISLILSLLVFPVSAAEKPEVSLSVVSFEENKQFGAITEKEAAAEYKAGDTLALKIGFTNDGTARTIFGYGFNIMYDKDALTPYYFKTDSKKTIGPLIDNLEGLNPDNFDNDGSAVISSVLVNGIEYDANEQGVFAYVLFQVNSDVETGSVQFSVNSDYNNNVIIDETGTKFTDFDYETLVASAKVTGNPPALGSVVITPDDGNAEATYGEEKTYTLKALSTKDKDITDCVSWSVNFNGDHANGIDITGNTLTIKADADILAREGEYTVVATPITGKCSGEAKTGTFTILPKKISSLKLSLTNYGKGLSVSGATVTGPEYVYITQSGLQWFVNQTEAVDSGNFAAATVYYVKVPFSLNSNYKLEASEAKLYVNASIETIAAQTVIGTIETHEADGLTSYSATFELPATGEKDTPELTPPDAITTTYGTTLTNSDLKNGSAKVGTETVTGTFSWPNNSQEVGDVNGSPYEYDVIFTPNNQNDYATATTKVTVTVNPASISEATVEIANQVYGEGNPVPTVTLGDKTLVLDTDYEVTYSNNTDVGTATATITGKGNYTGTATKTFQITKSISACTIDEITGTFVYSGTAYEPTVTVKDGNTVLTQGENNDYTVSYSSNINAGTATVTVTGKGNYTGSVEKHFTIEPQHLSINTSTISIDGTFTYDGEEKKPNVPTLTVGTKTPVTLTLGTDYTVEYDNNINAGSEAKIIFKPKTGSNYTFDEFTKTFTIKKGTLENVETEKNVSVRYGDSTERTFSAADVTGLAGKGTFSISHIQVPDGNTIFTYGEFKGLMTYHLKTTKDNVDQTISVQVTFHSDNYEDVTVTLKVTIVGKLDANLMVNGITDKMSMTYGDTKTLTWSVAEAAKGGKIEVTSSAADVIAVEENRTLRAVKVGTAKITVKYETADYYDEAEFNITVNKKPITVTAENMTVVYGDGWDGLAYDIPDDALVGKDSPLSLNIKPETKATSASPVGE